MPYLPRSSPHRKKRNPNQWSPKLPGIYLLKNLKTGEGYVGQSVDIGRRYKQHIGHLFGSQYGYKHKHHNSNLAMAMAHSELSEWAFIILELIPKDTNLKRLRANLRKREKHFINLHGTLNISGKKGAKSPSKVKPLVEPDSYLNTMAN
jgi:predicted GIY-YIG superfamily endonuclease